MTPGYVERGDADAPVQRALAQPPHEHVGLLLDDLEIDQGIGPHEGREQQRQDGRREGGDDAEAVRPGDMLAAFDDLCEMVDLLEDQARVRDDRGSALRREHRLTRAVEERLRVTGGLQHLLDLLDLGAERGLRYMTGASRFAKTAVAVDGDDVAQLLDGQAR